MSSRVTTLLGAFAGVLIYRSFRAGGIGLMVVIDAAAIALITTGLIVLYDRLKASRRR